MARISFTEQGDRFAVMEGEGRVGLYDFDRCSGEIAYRDSIVKVVSQHQTFNGLSFSPSGKYLYTNDVEPSDSSVLYQYCLDSANLMSSEILIHKFDNAGQSILKLFFGSKLAPDGKIYLTHDWGYDSLTSLDSLSIIEYPDSHGLACGFNLLGLPMTGAAPSYNPPNIPNYRLGPLMPQAAEAGPDQKTCPGEAVQIGIPDTTGNMTFEWVPATGLDDPFAAQPLAAPPSSTTYYLMVTDTTLPPGCNTTEDTVRVTVIDDTSPPQISLTNDTTICQGEELTLAVTNQPDWFYTWSMGGNLLGSNPEISISPDQSDVIYLQVWDTLAGDFYTCRADQDSMQITVETPLIHAAPTGGTFCQGQILQIGVAPQPGLEYSWSPAEGLSSQNTSWTQVNVPGNLLYTLTISDPSKITECGQTSFEVEVEGFPQELTIYPNPANRTLKIDPGGQQISIRVINPLGQVLEEQTSTGFLEIDCSPWRPGMYFLQWELECGSGVSRVLIVRE